MRAISSVNATDSISMVRADRLLPGMFIRLFGPTVRVLSAALYRDGTVLCRYDDGNGSLESAEPNGKTWLDADESLELVTLSCRRKR
ncbi:hypothetical protein [Ideonella sp.]|uniref:hypothetical protein n=1 Tax=Ideonella sp. TaxID=1929293 RepID=UPI0035B01B4A